MKNESGQGLVEYLILVCLIGVSAIAIVSLIGANIREQYAKVSGALGGGGPSVTLTKAKKGDYQRRSLEDFDEGAEVGH